MRTQNGFNLNHLGKNLCRYSFHVADTYHKNTKFYITCTLSYSVNIKTMVNLICSVLVYKSYLLRCKLVNNLKKLVHLKRGQEISWVDYDSKFRCET